MYNIINMLSKTKNLKIFLILILLASFSNKLNAAGFVEFNADSSSAQNSCVFDVHPEFLLNGNYDTDSAQVDLEVPEASFKKTLQLSSDGVYGYTDTTVTAPLPETTKSFRFIANYYMSPASSSTRTLVSKDDVSVTCVNPAFDAKQNQNQSTGILYSAIPKGTGSTIQYGNKSFNIGGVGSALSGCLGVGAKISSAIGGAGNVGSVDVTDVKASQKESCGDALAYAASRIVIQNISKSTIGWATGGNNGNPYYPTDYRSLYENIKSKEIQSFINELQTNDTKNPYSSSFAKSLANKTREQTKPFAEKYAYSGPSASFFNDFKKGGWESWYKYMLIPQNNSLGYSEIASKKAEDLKNQAVSTVQEELQNNNGFLSQKVCDDKNFREIANDTEKSKLLAAAAKGDKAAITSLNNSVCKNYKISTPGSIIAKQLQDVLGSPLRQTEQIDEVNEALGSVFDGIVAKLITNGLNSLSVSSFKSGVDFSYNSSAQNAGYEKTATGGSFWDNFKTSFDLHRDLPGIIKTQEAYLSQLNKNNQILGQVLKSIDKMDYSLPGPRLGWASGIQERIYTTSAGIKREAQLQMGGLIGNLVTLGMRDKILDGIEGVFIKVFTTTFDFYQTVIINKFDPSFNTKMPRNSSRMVTMIGARQSYQEIYSETATEIQSTKEVVLQLNDINSQVISLYKKACERFKKENPGSACVY